MQHAITFVFAGGGAECLDSERSVTQDGEDRMTPKPQKPAKGSARRGQVRAGVIEFYTFFMFVLLHLFEEVS